MDNIYGTTKEEISKNLLQYNRLLFKNEIEALMMNHKLNIIDAIEMYCLNHEVEIENLMNLIEGSLKDKLEEYAIQRNLFKAAYRKPQLPI